MSATKTRSKKGAKSKAGKTTRKATSEALDAIKANLDQIDGRPRKAKVAKGTETAADVNGAKKLSAIDAAARVLAGAAEPLTTQQMIDAMAAQNLWSSPGGKTPAATLYSAILREIKAKGDDARFVKTERGKFAAKP